MVGTYNDHNTEHTTDHSAEQAAAQRERSLDQQIAALVDIVRANQYRIDRLEARSKRAKAELVKLLQQRGDNWADDEGYARLVSEGERVSYDKAALDELLMDDPLRYGWLKDYRRKSTVSGGVRVK